MNKSDLIGAISDTTSLMKRETGNAMNAPVSVVVVGVPAGSRVAIAGSDPFNPTQRGARTERLPHTGAPVKTAASGDVRFAPGGTVNAIVNVMAPLPAVRASPVPTTTPHTSITMGLKKLANKSTNREVRGAPATTAAETPVGKVARRAQATEANRRAPARKTAKRSANKAVRRAPANRPARHAPARKAAQRSAKKAVRRA